MTGSRVRGKGSIVHLQSSALGGTSTQGMSAMSASPRWFLSLSAVMGAWHERTRGRPLSALPWP